MIQNNIQKIFILTTGKPATQAQISEYSALFTQTGDFSAIMAKVELDNESTLIKVVQNAALWGFNVELTEAQALDILASMGGSPTVTELLNFAMEQLSPNLTAILDNKALAANLFAENASEDINLSSAEDMLLVQEWLGTVDASVESVYAVLIGLTDTIEDILADDVVMPEPEDSDPEDSDPEGSDPDDEEVCEDCSIEPIGVPDPIMDMM